MVSDDDVNKNDKNEKWATSENGRRPLMKKITSLT